MNSQARPVEPESIGRMSIFTPVWRDYKVILVLLVLMLVATTVGIFFIPLFFATIRGLADRGLFRRRQHAVATPAMASPDAE